ncbi:DUF5348 domain-containing protein [Ktedonobacter sp. SOSP1-52]|uniref:DUF5348 domain-containing protein n=1 Tax=Ktedonobacter sp. SOSP1-52 TaxID=2778366 RepID=UPI001914E450|nr:DUF5348 domain-containing protein [Ktedonobacter sp. SOSP1-52]
MINQHEGSLSPGVLRYDMHHHKLQLNEQLLTPEMWIEICVFHDWIPGQVQSNAAGWYLQTRNHIGIRLRAGLTARVYVAQLPSCQETPLP